MRVDLNTHHVMIASERTGNLIALARIAASEEDLRNGLLAEDGLPPGQGMWFTPCEHIHTFGMKFAIDVCFLDSKGYVLATFSDVNPSRHCRRDGAATCLELPAGAIQASGLRIGERLLITPLD